MTARNVRYVEVFMFRNGNLAFGWPLLVLFALPLLTDPLAAQRQPLFVSPTDYQRLGLERAWSSQIEIDPQQTSVAAMTLQIVGLNSYEGFQETAVKVFEVSYDTDRVPGGRVTRFAENDLDVSGQMLGEAEAKRLAEKLVILLEAEGRQPQLDVKTVPVITLYVQANSGLLQAIDAETGKTRWKRSVGTPGHPALRPGANDEFVVTIRGSQLYLFERASGRPIWDRPLRQNPTFGATVSQRHVFVPGTRGRVEGYPLPDEEADNRSATPWIYSTGARITAPPLVTDSTVSFGTARGQMFVARVDRQLGPEMMYRYEAKGIIYGDVAYLPPNHLVIGSMGGYVSSIEQQDGLLNWRYSAGEQMQTTPMAHLDATYVTTVSDALHCIDNTDGSQRWVTEGVSEVLAIGEDRLYGRDGFDRLVAIDAATGQHLGSLPIGAYDIALNNHLTDRIYLVSNDGQVLCLRETDASVPQLHYPLPEPPSEEPAGQRRSAADDTQTAPDSQPATGDDPFGEGMFAEPEDDGQLPGDDLFDMPEDPTVDESPASGDATDDAPIDDGDVFDFSIPEEDSAPTEDTQDAGDSGAADDEPVDDDIFDFGS